MLRNVKGFPTKRPGKESSPIHKFSGLFSEKQYFFYHESNFQNRLYFEALIDSFRTSGKRSYIIVQAINYHHGIIMKSELPNYSMSPVYPIAGHMLFSTLINKLIQHNIVCDYDEDNYTLNSRIIDTLEPNFRHYKAIQFAKNMVIQQFAVWSKKIGLSSYNKGEKNNQVGGFQFAFTAPSYIDGITKYKSGRPDPGFLVADILLGNNTDEYTIDFFLQKMAVIKASNKSAKLFPVLLLDGISSDGYHRLKSKGVLIASIKEIYGKDYSELLKNLINTITNAGAILKTDPERYVELMDKLTKMVDGKTNNLRGDLFELAVGYYYSKLCKSLDIGKRVVVGEGNRKREIDVLAIYENEIRVVECKGYNYAIEEDYIEGYLSKIVPEIRKWLNMVYPNRRHIFEIWSTGGFTEKATELFLTAKERTKKYDLCQLNKAAILAKADEIHSNKFKEILRDYYLKEIV